MRGRSGGHNFFGRHYRIPTRSCYLRKTLRRARCGGAYLVCSGRGRPQIRWGVVQPVGHHTVNVDGEGSNPSAPANLILIAQDAEFAVKRRLSSRRTGAAIDAAPFPAINPEMQFIDRVAKVPSICSYPGSYRLRRSQMKAPPAKTTGESPRFAGGT